LQQIALPKTRRFWEGTRHIATEMKVCAGREFQWVVDPDHEELGPFVMKTSASATSIIKDRVIPLFAVTQLAPCGRPTVLSTV
jgi:hypothetical protein